MRATATWLYINDWERIWAARAAQGNLDPVRVRHPLLPGPRRRLVRVFADRNGDGDALDKKERSPVIHRATLRRETAGGSPTDGLEPGESIPSHLRVGIYHDPAYRCQGGRCSIGIDNVGVYQLP